MELALNILNRYLEETEAELHQNTTVAGYRDTGICEVNDATYEFCKKNIIKYGAIKQEILLAIVELSA